MLFRSPESDGAKERAAKIEDLKKRQQELNLQYKDAILYNQNLVKLKDEEWQKTLNLGKENRIVTTQILNQQRAYNKQKNSFENKNSGGSKTPPPPASGSIAKIDAQITEAQKSYANATSNEARIAAQKTIDALNGQKIQLVAEITETMFREKYSYDANKGSQKMSGIKKSGIDTKNMQLDKIESPITDEMIAKNFDYAASFAYINTALNAMGNATNEATSSWLNYSANVIAGVAAMIPSIATLFKGKAALAIAEQAGLPVPLNFIAMGATGAALAATIASIPKFASGGVFGGNSTIGDMNLARVNSGEMILNHSQQGRLFSMLNNGESFNNNKGTAQAEFTIKGRNLDAILK